MALRRQCHETSGGAGALGDRNIVTTSDELFRYAASDEASDQATKEALRYRTALYEGVEALRYRPLTVGTAERVCSRIKNVEISIRPGRRWPRLILILRPCPTLM